MTMLDSYVYHVDLEWSGKRSGRLNPEGLPPIAFSAPPEFAGDPGRWTPEHLLTAATATCFLTTFIAIAELHKLEVRSFTMTAYARLEKVPGEGYRFTEITLAPRIQVAQEDVEKALKVVAKSEKNCFISNSLKAKVQVEPHFSPVVAELAV
jgi:peroxiredoxin-like protein